MKKLTFKFSNSADTIEEFYTSQMDKLTESQFVSIYEKIQIAIANGDVWLRHYCLVDSEAHLIWFLDSADSQTNFQPVIEILETLDDYITLDAEEVTFEEFATFAAAHEESIIPHARKEALNPQ
jgi:hypothetical protein